MPLRQLVTSSPENLSDMLLAAEDRYKDAEELLAQDRLDGCVYLLGFAAEMWLKAACMRLRGLGPADPVFAALTALKGFMKQVAPTIPFDGYHDLSFYVGCIRTLRSRQNRPLPGQFELELNTRMVRSLHQEWIVDMRYRRVNVTAPQAWEALEDTWWIKSNWLQLL
jgi:hypothetical protein